MTDQDQRVCSEGKIGPGYSCTFCYAVVHHGDDPCPCSAHRTSTYYATLCSACAEALDILTADTIVGRVHKHLVREARLTHMRSGDE